MANAGLKTRPSGASVDHFLKSITDPVTRADAVALVAAMREATGAPPRMWGSAIVGFGEYHYVYESGREGDWFLLGFSPRKRNLTLYLMSGFASHGPLMEKLGRYSTGGSCLYIRRLGDIHLPILKRVLRASVRETLKRYGGSSA